MMRAVEAGERRRVLSVVAATGIAFGMTYPFVPLLAIDLGASPITAGLVSGANVPAMLLVDGLGTRAIPRLEARGVLVAALLSFGIGSALAAAATGVTMLLCSRLFEGVGIALFMTGGIHLMTRSASVHERGRAIGSFNACWFLGAAVGPVIGGALAQQLDGIGGLRLAFAACAAVSFACALLIRVALRRQPRTGPARLSLPSLQPIARDGRLLRAVLLGGHSEAVRDGFMMVVLPLSAASAGLTDLSVGVTLTVLAFADVVSMHVSGHLADRYGRMRPLTISLVVAACAAMAGTHAHSTATFAVLALALGASLGAAWVVPPTMVLDLATDHEAAVAAYRLCADVGLFVGASGSGALLQAVGAETAFAGMAIALLAGAALAASIGDTRPISTQTLQILEVTS
jgi:MFS family permease